MKLSLLGICFLVTFGMGFDSKFSFSDLLDKVSEWGKLFVNDELMQVFESCMHYNPTFFGARFLSHVSGIEREKCYEVIILNENNFEPLNYERMSQFCRIKSIPLLAESSFAMIEDESDQQTAGEALAASNKLKAHIGLSLRPGPFKWLNGNLMLRQGCIDIKIFNWTDPRILSWLNCSVKCFFDNFPWALSELVEDGDGHCMCSKEIDWSKTRSCNKTENDTILMQIVSTAALNTNFSTAEEMWTGAHSFNNYQVNSCLQMRYSVSNRSVHLTDADCDVAKTDHLLCEDEQCFNQFDGNSTKLRDCFEIDHNSLLNFKEASRKCNLPKIASNPELEGLIGKIEEEMANATWKEIVFWLGAKNSEWLWDNGEELSGLVLNPLSENVSRSDNENCLVLHKAEEPEMAEWETVECQSRVFMCQVIKWRFPENEEQNETETTTVSSFNVTKDGMNLTNAGFNVTGPSIVTTTMSSKFRESTTTISRTESVSFVPKVITTAESQPCQKPCPSPPPPPNHSPCREPCPSSPASDLITLYTTTIIPSAVLGMAGGVISHFLLFKRSTKVDDSEKGKRNGQTDNGVPSSSKNMAASHKNSNPRTNNEGKMQRKSICACPCNEPQFQYGLRTQISNIVREFEDKFNAFKNNIDYHFVNVRAELERIASEHQVQHETQSTLEEHLNNLRERVAVLESSLLNALSTHSNVANDCQKSIESPRDCGCSCNNEEGLQKIVESLLRKNELIIENQPKSDTQENCGCVCRSDEDIKGSIEKILRQQFEEKYLVDVQNQHDNFLASFNDSKNEDRNRNSEMYSELENRLKEEISSQINTEIEKQKFAVDDSNFEKLFITPQRIEVLSQLVSLQLGQQLHVMKEALRRETVDLATIAQISPAPCDCPCRDPTRFHEAMEGFALTRLFKDKNEPFKVYLTRRINEILRANTQYWGRQGERGPRGHCCGHKSPRTRSADSRLHDDAAKPTQHAHKAGFLNGKLIHAKYCEIFGLAKGIHAHTEPN